MQGKRLEKQPNNLGLLYKGAILGAINRAIPGATILILIINTYINTLYKLTSKKIRCFYPLNTKLFNKKYAGFEENIWFGPPTKDSGPALFRHKTLEIR